MLIPKVDLHNHSRFSDSDGTILEIVAQAEKRGMEMVGISDHHDYLPPKKFDRYVKEIERWDSESSIEVKKGIEIDIGSNGIETMVDERSLNKLDYVIGSFHDFVLNVDKNKKFNAFKFAIKSNLVDVIGHPKMDFSKERMLNLVELADEFGTAFEINCSYMVPRDQFLRICLDNGVKLAIGSDSHSVESVGNIGWCTKLLERNNFKSDDLFIPGGLNG